MEKENEFRFFGYHPELNDFVNGSVIKVSYHQESRRADSNASQTIYYWVIDDIRYGTNYIKNN